MCQFFIYFSGILHNFVLAKLATSSIRLATATELTGPLFLTVAQIKERECRLHAVLHNSLPRGSNIAISSSFPPAEASLGDNIHGGNGQ